MPRQRPISLNRLLITPFPSITIDGEARGKTAGHLISRHALIQTIRANADSLGLLLESIREESPEENRLLFLFNTCFESDNAAIRYHAEHIARRFGRDLAYIILCLHFGDESNRSAQSFAPAGLWDKWHTITRFWIGGGLVAGHLGERAILYAQELLAETGLNLTVALSPYCHIMPLTGVARYADCTAAGAVVFDFGNSAVKCAYGQIEAGQISALRLPHPFPTHNYFDSHAISMYEGKPTPELTGGFMAGVIASTIRQILDNSLPLSATVPCSIAVHLENGRGVSDQGYYAGLSQLEIPAADYLSQWLQTRYGLAYQIVLINDGIAAATVHAGDENTAAIVIGSAIGSGFVPSEQNLCPLLHPLRIMDFDN